MKTSEEKRIIVDSRGFLVKINGDDIVETALEKVIFTLEIICNVPIFIFQFPKPNQILMIPVELTKESFFGNFKQLRITFELAGKTTDYSKEILMSETDSNKIKHCLTNLPKRINIGRAEVEEYVN